jgi:hypothetical protein
MSARKFLPLALVSLMMLPLGCEEESEPDDHGSIHIQFNGTGPEIFAGTSRITANVSYGAECLGSFYESNSNWAYDGVDGGDVFEEWKDRLCDQGEFDRIVDCEVISIEQQSTMTGLKLKVHYKITGSDLYLREVRVGPIPTEALAGCYPTMKIDAGSVGGFDDVDPLSGGQVWNIESYDVGVTSVNEGAPVTITAKRT